jgi:FkbM family methyltransferase
VRRGGISWDLDLREGIDLYIYLAGRFEWSLSRVLTSLVRPGDTIVDAGANVGAHALPLARAAGPDGRIFAYEPTGFAYGKLLANIALNPALASRIVPVQAMLIGEPGARAAPAIPSSWPLVTADDLHPEHGGRAMSTDGARAVTLDDHLREVGVSQIALIKIDVDGFECSVLRGAQGILRACRPVIVMEWAPYLHEAAGHRLQTCLSVVRDLGYSFHDASSGESLPADLASVARRSPPGVSINVVGRA